MLIKIFKVTRSIVLSIALISLILFSGWDRAAAVKDLSFISDKADNSLQMPIEQSDSNQMMGTDFEEEPIEDNQMTNYPDLGDAQVFPFVAGLDSYE